MEDFEKRRSAFKSRVAGLQYIQIEIKKKSKQTNKQTNGLFRRDNIKRFARFTLHTKTTTGISWYLMHWNYEKLNKLE